ncbi:MAG: ABC transporter permease [Candidatus Competibacteraceae bacterium]|nr:ABC transporter permease [Candidatus Competibacteraceae bacterium]
MKAYRKYFINKFLWFLLTLVTAFILNFFLPRLMPGDPVAAIVARMAQGQSNATGVQAVYEQYTELFGTDKPMSEQFIIYIRNVFRGDFGYSISQYPRRVSDVIRSSIGWTIALQFPAIIVGWILGNALGALAAYSKGYFDKILLPLSIFFSNIPAFGMAIMLVVIFGVNLDIFPTSGGYGHDMIPNNSLKFVWSVIVHYQLPFWSIVLITIGGQAVGMRSMAIYELNADYVKYSRFMGIKDRKIVGYVFRNAMLPQITGLALSMGTMVGGALITETVFNYPGIGTWLFTAIRQLDYPLISGCTLMISVAVLLANFTIDILYGLLDPRIRAAQSEER